MLVDSVKEGNRLRWDGKERPFFEIYTIKLIDPKREWSLWIRYSLLVPQDKSVTPTASLMSVFHPFSELPIAIKRTFPLTEIDLFHRDHFLQIGQGFFNLGQACGHVEDEKNQIAWDLHFDDPILSSHLYPYSWFYSGPFLKTKFMEPGFSTFLTGQFRINMKSYYCDHAIASQNHVWGNQLTSNWVWAHCNNFAEDSQAAFEGLVSPLYLGPGINPEISLFQFKWNNKIYSANSTRHWLFNVSEHTFFNWHFEAICKDIKFIGYIKRDSPRIVGINYHGPKGEKFYCHNTMAADMELSIWVKENKRWYFKEKLTAYRSCAFETVDDERNPQIRFLL